MSKGTIKYSQEFKSEFGNKWIGIDLVVNENDNWDEKFKVAECMVIGWGNPNSVHDFSIGGIQMQVPISQPIQSIDPRAKDLEEIIQDCSSLEELKKLKDEAGRLGLLSAYSSKLLTFKK